MTSIGIAWDGSVYPLQQISRAEMWLIKPPGAVNVFRGLPVYVVCDDRRGIAVDFYPEPDREYEIVPWVEHE